MRFGDLRFRHQIFAVMLCIVGVALAGTALIARPRAMVAYRNRTFDQLASNCHLKASWLASEFRRYEADLRLGATSPEIAASFPQYVRTLSTPEAGGGAADILRSVRAAYVEDNPFPPNQRAALDGSTNPSGTAYDDTREAPVIFLSAMGETADKVKGLELGAVDYVTKPIQTEEVLARVRTHLTIRRLNRELEARCADIERELEVVANVQRSLLPRALPDIDGMSLAAHYATSRYAGGDYYDVVSLPDNQWGFLMADVSGHGTPSAVVMAMMHAIFHAYPGPRIEPAGVLMYVNDHLRPALDRSFVTALYAVYDAGSRTLRMARAGHPEALLYRPDRGETTALEAEGVFPLGLFAYENVPTTEHTLRPGDRLLLYTDGIIERFNANLQDYGSPRLLDQLARCCAGSPQKTIDAIMNDVDAFAGDKPADDDQTLLLGLVH